MMKSVTNIHRFADADALGRSVAADIADRIESVHARGAQFVLGCPGGRTPRTTYHALADEARIRGIDMGRVIIAMMDDYLQETADGWAPIDATAHNSCRRFAREEIQAVLNSGVVAGSTLPDSNVWFPDPGNPADYDNRLRQAGGVNFFILASGAGDGHVAFNPPGSEESSRSRIVTLAEQTRADNLATFPQFRDLSEVPTHGVTVGIATIAELSAAAAMILVGTDKQRAYRRITQGVGYDPSWPATVCRMITDSAIYVDARADGSLAET